MYIKNQSIKNLDMKKKLIMAAVVLTGCLQMNAQSVKLNGVLHNNRYDDGDQMKSTWIGSLYDENGNYTGKTAYIVDNGLYTMTWDGSALSAPIKEPEVNLSDIKQGSQVNYEKALWATNFNLMYGNSGAVYVDGKIWTVMSRDEQSTVDEELFAVRKWDAKTGDLLSGSSDTYPKSACLESAGMSFNPIDGKVYGLFYLTEQQLADEITSDPDFFTDTDGDATAEDAGYCICTIDLETMKITPVTPGLYYYNFVTFAINSEGRAFALTSGGSAGYQGDDGRIYNMDQKLAGAQLCEFDLSTGLMLTKPQQYVDPDTQETYTEQVNIYDHGTGYCSQYRRQSACFAKSNPNKMYWNGFVNSGKGINEYGSWTSLPDREWRTNEKYDTALYEVDITTGTATRLSKVTNRCIFSVLWADGDDCSDGATSGISETVAELQHSSKDNAVYNLAGQRVSQPSQGLYIVGGRKVVIK